MPKVNKTPRISLNKLAEYLEATATRRRQIIYEAKFPSSFITTRYKDAGETIILYLIGSKNEHYVLAAIEEFKKRVARNPNQGNDNKLSAELLKSFLKSDMSFLDGCKIKICDFENVLVKIKGVDISIRPDLIISKRIKDTLQIGAIKLYLVKTKITDEGQKTVAAMVYDYVNNYLIHDGGIANPKLCISFNIFKNHFEFAPRAFKLRMKQIENSCEEIASRWDSIKL